MCGAYLHSDVVTLPTGPPTHQLLRTISLLGRWSTSGPDRGIAHFFMATRNTIEGVGKKNKTKTDEQNEQYEPGVNSKCKTRSYVTLCILVSIYRLMLAWISSETSTKLLGMPTYTDRSSSLLWTLSHANSTLCCPVSTARSVVRRQPPSSSSFVHFSHWRSLPTSGHVEIAGPNPLSVSCQNRQRGHLLGGPPT